MSVTEIDAIADNHETHRALKVLIKECRLDTGYCCVQWKKRRRNKTFNYMEKSYNSYPLQLFPLCCFPIPLPLVCLFRSQLSWKE